MLSPRTLSPRSLHALSTYALSTYAQLQEEIIQLPASQSMDQVVERISIVETAGKMQMGFQKHT